MKFTKGLFLGTAIGISAAMMMNNKSKNGQSNANTAANNYSSTGITTNNDTQPEDYISNDII